MLHNRPARIMHEAPAWLLCNRGVTNWLWQIYIYTYKLTATRAPRLLASPFGSAISSVLIRRCVWRHLCCRLLLSCLSWRRELPHITQVSTPLLFNRLRNVLLESTPLIATLIPTLSLMAPISKAFTLLLRKSDRSDAEVGERHQSHMLRLAKVCSVKKLSVNDFPALHKWHTQSSLKQRTF